MESTVVPQSTFSVPKTSTNLLLNLRLQQKGSHDCHLFDLTKQKLMDASECLFDPSFEMEGIYQKYINHISKNTNI